MGLLRWLGESTLLDRLASTDIKKDASRYFFAQYRWFEQSECRRNNSTMHSSSRVKYRIIRFRSRTRFSDNIHILSCPRLITKLVSSMSAACKWNLCGRGWRHCFHDPIKIMRKDDGWKEQIRNTALILQGKQWSLFD